MMILCQQKHSCISCCTRGIERISKDELDAVMREHSRAFAKISLKKDSLISELKKYVKSIGVNLRVCEYLGFLDKKERHAGCLVHPECIGEEIRHKAPKNNIFRGKCTSSKDCMKSSLISDMTSGVRKKLCAELEKSKDYYDYSMKVKHLIPRVYVQHKLKGTKLNKPSEAYLKFVAGRIVREPEQKRCEILKQRLDSAIKTARFMSRV